MLQMQMAWLGFIIEMSGSDDGADHHPLSCSVREGAGITHILQFYGYLPKKVYSQVPPRSRKDTFSTSNSEKVRCLTY
jgi:hypothetical protein